MRFTGKIDFTKRSFCYGSIVEIQLYNVVTLSSTQCKRLQNIIIKFEAKVSLAFIQEEDEVWRSL